MATRESPLNMVTWRCTRRCDGNCVSCRTTPKHSLDAEVNAKTVHKIVDEIYYMVSTCFGISGRTVDQERNLRHYRLLQSIGFDVGLIPAGWSLTRNVLTVSAERGLHCARKYGICDHRERCGGCRTRDAYYKSDLLENDLTCVYILICFAKNRTANTKT